MSPVGFAMSFGYINCWEKVVIVPGAGDKKEKIETMAKKENLNKLSVYIPEEKKKEKAVERLVKLSKKKVRSVNYLVVEAILQYLDREEK